MSQHAPRAPQPAAIEEDRFPRMIVVCMAIALALLILILGLVLYESIGRAQPAQDQSIKPFAPFDAPPGTIEGNPIPIAPPAN